MAYRPRLKKDALISPGRYRKMYNESVKRPAGFWREMASGITWKKRFNRVFEKTKEGGRWFVGGKLNISENCLDRHVKEEPWKTALIWEGEFGEALRYSYRELLLEVNRAGNVLKRLGVKKGERVCIYMPMIPEAIIAMLACCRIGAVHSVVFGGFSSPALKERIIDSKSKIVITADGGFRRGKIIPLKKNVDNAIRGLKFVKKVLVVKRAGEDVVMRKGRDLWWEEEMRGADEACKAEAMNSNDPLFILYTSGSTGKARGVIHLTGGYAVYTYTTFRYLFDYKDDVYWCTADLGWITGHSYVVYGPLMNRATVFVYESVPDYPAPDRWWGLIEKYNVNIFYTAPTAIRALEKYGDVWVRKHDLSSLRLLGSVGEPISAKTWKWYYSLAGGKRCPILDTWWQTETGGIMISPFASFALKPGSAMKPFFGIVPGIVDKKGDPVRKGESGFLTITRPWPARGRTLGKEGVHTHENYELVFDAFYLTGDQAKQDKDGDYWLLGRIDHVIKVSGHRIGGAEIEGVLTKDPAVIEAAVVPIPHKIKGWNIAAFVVLKKGVSRSDALKRRLIEKVADTLGHFTRPGALIFADELPKNRSGKIIRPILKQIAAGEDVGKFATLANPKSVEKLRKRGGI